MVMKREVLGISLVSLLLLSVAFFPLFEPDSGNDLKLLQAEEETMAIWIVSRGFMPGNPHYVPQNVTAKIGTVVTWINGDLVHHTATSDEGVQGKLEGQIFDSGPIPPRNTFTLDTSRMLDDVYPFHCMIHPWTRGTLTLITEPISVVTDKSAYQMGEKITVSGIASIPVPSGVTPDTVPKELEGGAEAGSVSLQVLGPRGEEFLSREVPVLGGGRYSYSFTASDAGEYVVKASFRNFTAGTRFSIEPLQTGSMTTLGISFEDKRGIPATEGRAGNLIFIKTSVKNMLQIGQDYLYIVQVKDANEATVFLEWMDRSIGPLGLSSPAITWIPENEGTYTVEAFIWTDVDSPTPLSTTVERAALIVL